MSLRTYNEIFVTGKEDRINQFLAECTVDGYLSFSKCLPMPKELQPVDPKNPSLDAHAWRVEHWGTGYDCYDINEEASPFATFELDDGLTLASADFDTEWMAPIAAINTLRARYMDLTFFVNSMDEDGSIKDIFDSIECEIEDEDDDTLRESFFKRIDELRDDAFGLETSFTSLVQTCALSGQRLSFDNFEVTISHKVEDSFVAARCISFLKNVETFQSNLNKLYDDLIAYDVQEEFNDIDTNLDFFRSFVTKVLVQLDL